MKVKKLVYIIFGISLSINSSVSNADELMNKAKSMFAPISGAKMEIKDNPITQQKIDLGAKLFFDTRLSKSGLISCNTCHNLGMGGDDNLPTSVGHGWAKGPRNAPTVLNAVFNIAQFWDGRADDLKAQAKGPIQAGVEMANTPENVENALNSIPAYVEEFTTAFPDDEKPVSFDNMAKAIEAFETTLITPDAPFDKYLEGDESALSAEEKEGLNLFMAKGCAACHGGANLGGQGYYAFGVVEKPGSDVLPEGDKGRFSVTKTATDNYVFRAGPLRNIALTAPYFHSGQVWDLEQAVAIMGSSQLGVELTDNETNKITTFLKTLTGTQPKVEYPILPVETAETPRPAL